MKETSIINKEKTIKKKVLVTGASGILGSHACTALHETGYEVHALIRKTSSRKWLQDKWLNIHVAELDDRKRLSNILKDMDVIVHNAGVTSGSSEEACQKVNVTATITLAEESIKAGVSRFVFVSSRSAAGSNKGRFMRTEDDPDYPLNPYCCSKKKAEELLYGFRKKIEIVSLRFALLYGPHDTHLLPIFKMLSRRIHAIAGLGAIYTPMLYLKDAALAITSAVTARPSSFKSGSFYYVSDGIPYNLDSFYDLILASYGQKSLRIRIPLWVLSLIAWILGTIVKKRTGLTRESVMELRSGSRLVSPVRFMDDFGWKPKTTPYEAFSETVRWYLKQGWIKDKYQIMV